MKNAIIKIIWLVLATPALALGQTTGEVQQNMEVIRQQHDKLNRGDWRAAASDFADDAINNGRPRGQQGVRGILESIYATFPDARFDIIEMVAQGDEVVVHCKFSGTHLGVGYAAVGQKPTGKHFEVQHMHWYKLRDGKIVDHYAVRDDLGMLRQLGLVPSTVSSDGK